MLNKPSNNGFSLIEIMIVLTMVSVLFIGLLTTYRQIQKLLSTQSRASVQGNQAEQLYEILSHDIENMVYEKWNKKFFFKTQKNIVSSSRIDDLNFITGSLYSNPQVRQSSFYNVTYFGKPDENGKLTLYRKEDMFVDYKETSHGVSIPVLTNITEFRVEFSKDGKDWLDTWENLLTKTIPSFIRITIQYESDMNSSGQTRTMVLQISPGIYM